MLLKHLENIEHSQHKTLFKPNIFFRFHFLLLFRSAFLEFHRETKKIRRISIQKHIFSSLSIWISIQKKKIKFCLSSFYCFISSSSLCSCKSGMENISFKFSILKRHKLMNLNLIGFENRIECIIVKVWKWKRKKYCFVNRKKKSIIEAIILMQKHETIKINI